MRWKNYIVLFLVMCGLAAAPSVLTGCEEDAAEEIEDVGEGLGD